MRYRRSWALAAAAVAVAALLALGPPVRAGFKLTLTDTTNGGSATGINNAANDGATFTGTVGKFSVIVDTGSSNTPGTPNLGFVSNSTDTIKNIGSTTATLEILVSANGFTAPTAPQPLTMKDSVSATLQVGAGSITAQGFGDTSDTLGGQAFAAPKLSLATMTVGVSDSANGSRLGFNPGGTTPFSLTYIIDVTLDAGGSVLVGQNGQVTLIPAPEPASMVMAFSALPFLGLGAWVRRRKGVLMAV